MNNAILIAPLWYGCFTVSRGHIGIILLLVALAAVNFRERMISQSLLLILLFLVGYLFARSPLRGYHRGLPVQGRSFSAKDTPRRRFSCTGTSDAT